MKQELVKYELEKKKSVRSNGSLKNRMKKGTGQMEVGKQYNKNWSKFKGSWKKTPKKTGIIKWELNGDGEKKEEKKN